MHRSQPYTNNTQYQRMELDQPQKKRSEELIEEERKLSEARLSLVTMEQALECITEGVQNLEQRIKEKES